MGIVVAKILSAVGYIAANSLSTACVILWLDEPEMPEHLIK
ncbi:MAG: cyclic lactone autoinducer peptide [Mollicutes bacterium]|nr:cyclic lactone autoinducer peptide [Mollicutes bacterium]